MVGDHPMMLSKDYY